MVGPPGSVRRVEAASRLQPSFPQLFATVALLGFARAASFSATDLDAAPVQQPIQVDGVLDEWKTQGATFRPLVRSDPKLAAKDASAEVALRFDDDALYL